MVVRSHAAPPTPRSESLTAPQIHETAYIHSFSNIVGDVRIGNNVLVAPGTSIRADEGNTFHIGDGTKVQDGVVIHGLEQGRVVGDDNNSYSVWIGNNASITHMALIKGPAYIGDNCFIGFRSTIFNARVGQDCIVMMHALIQDVEVPPGKYVPSGSVITSQQQADRLQDVQESDIKFATHVVGINEALRSGFHAENITRIALRDEIAKSNQVSQSNSDNSNNQVHMDKRLRTEVVEQVRSLLAQGYRIGTEYADERRFQTTSWRSSPSIQALRESEVVAQLEACLNEHRGEYVRLIGIDPKSKKRVLETIIQRPLDQAGNTNSNSNSWRRTTEPASSSANGYSSNSQSLNSQSLSSDAVEQVRSLLSQGYQIGTEHADKRRFQTSSWQSCTPITTKRESEAIAALEECIANHEGEYVRLIGIDTKAKRRVLEIIIQRPDGKINNGTTTKSFSSAAPKKPASSSANGYSSNSDLSNDAIEQVRSLLSQGYQIGTEHADKRRFQTSSWQSCAPITTKRESEAIAALEECIANHEGEYVRLIGIDTKAKRRVLETIIQRPDGKVSKSSSNSLPAAPATNSRSSSPSPNTSLDSEVVQQVRSLLNQGCLISTEYADERRFKINSWQSAGVIQAKQESEALAALAAILNEHNGAYVRLIGIDPKGKRRVVEQTIQRPGK